ncbi:MAG: rhamnulokinase family protein [Propionibacteriaceae bacterium]|nr:rhamnulokinase family protein [Propionibacteriaceae bacterium]
MPDSRFFAAADLGASSGRVMLGELADGRLTLREVARWSNGPTDEITDSLHWDTPRLFDEIVAGFRAAQEAAGGRLESVAVDTWGVDYGRIGADGELLELPFTYRDARTEGAIDKVFGLIPASDLYATAGLQVQPFNTIFQLAAQAEDERWDDVETILLTPDLLGYWLTGRRYAEVTIASTTGLLDTAARTWSASTTAALRDRLGLPLPRVLPELVEPGTVVGTTKEGLLSEPVSVVAVGAHDTASAVVTVPAQVDDFAFISSGTWSLVGLELPAPVLAPVSEEANFTNELGVDGTTRFLKNVMGLWVLIECRREWAAESGSELSWDEIVEMASSAEPLAAVIDMEDERLLPPGDMVARVRALAAERGQELGDDKGSVIRCILDSLALSYRRAIREACRVAERSVSVVHVVGGGSSNALLCQLTADATGVPVVAGPTEGTAMGNLLVQARAMGALSGGLAELREVARASSEVRTFTPGALGIDPAAWDAAEERLA